MYYLEIGVSSKCSIAKASEYSPESIIVQNARIIEGDLNHVILSTVKRDSEQVISVLQNEIRRYESSLYGGNVFIDSYKMGHGMLKAVMAEDVFLLYPIIARNGVENFRLLSRNKSSLDMIVEQVESRNIIENRFSERVSVAEMVTDNLIKNSTPSVYGLTEREMETLKIAINSGYYEWPRKSDLGMISSGNRASKVTTLYHLRNAEKKIMEAIFKRKAY
ncbi:MAG: helix-turn-helix domain-containing protein [Cuniculiplasma sp.]